MIIIYEKAFPAFWESEGFMAEEKLTFDLILHPVRIRILMALTGQQLSPQELSGYLEDVPQATLYRHLNRLAEAGVIEVAAERPVRGTLEKVYQLNTVANQPGPEDWAQVSKEDHMRYFIAFVTSLLSDFSRYLQHTDRVDFYRDGVGYRTVQLELTDKEFAEMSAALNAALMPYLNRQPGEGRRRLLSTVVIPDFNPRDEGISESGVSSDVEINGKSS